MVQQKIRFDPTINLGHVLTFAAIIGVGIAGWYNLTTRVTVLEDARVLQKEIYATRVRVVDDKLSVVNADIREIRSDINRLKDKP